MQALIDDFDAAKKREQELSDNFEDAERKCARAKSLIEKLATEEVNWDISLKQNKADKLNLVGDVIISSGVIAYLGVFSFQYRDTAIAGWTTMLKEFQIKGTENFSLRDVIKSEVKIQQWFIEELPQEAFAVENAIIMDNSDRWPLMIDPQMQGNNWIKNMNKELIRSIKPTQGSKTQTRTIRACIELGYPLILEDANETFDPMLEPLLGKQIEKKGKNMFIKIGDDNIEYDPAFQFYVTTKLSRPHFAPEVCVKVTMLNFMVTYKGLEDQMLNIVVTHEDPNNMKKRNEAIIRRAANEKKKGELEDKILNQIATSETDILEDDVLLETLDESKAQCKQIDQQLEESQVIMRNIETIMDQFRPVALRVSRLFFVLI
jgi:dynein heavy chain